MYLSDIAATNPALPDFSLPDLSLPDMPALRFGDLTAKLPVIQGGMGVGISLSGLASAVAQEGGVGVIAAAMIGMTGTKKRPHGAQGHIDALCDELRRAREKTQGVLGVNIMVVLTNFADMVRASIKEGADIIFSGAGLPLDLPKYLTEDAKTKLVPIVSSGRAARILCKKWLARFNYLPDGFVVEGPKAGGHLGFKPEELADDNFAVEKLVTDVIEAVRPYEEKHRTRIPVIAAGGVYTGSDICQMMKLGVSGVQMGTRFVATHECDADIRFKQAFIDAKEEDLEIIKSPVGMPGRVIKSSFTQDIKEAKQQPFKCLFHCVSSCDYTTAPYCIAKALACAMRGKLTTGFAFAGSNVHRIKEIISVHELIDSLKREYREECTPR